MRWVAVAIALGLLAGVPACVQTSHHGLAPAYAAHGLAPHPVAPQCRGGQHHHGAAPPRHHERPSLHDRHHGRRGDDGCHHDLLSA